MCHSSIIVIYGSPNSVFFCFVGRQLPNFENHCSKRPANAETHSSFDKTKLQLWHLGWEERKRNLIIFLRGSRTMTTNNATTNIIIFNDEEKKKRLMLKTWNFGIEERPRTFPSKRVQFHNDLEKSFKLLSRVYKVMQYFMRHRYSVERHAKFCLQF